VNRYTYYIAYLRCYPKPPLPREQIERLLSEWRQAKETKNYEQADQLRSALEETGINVEEWYSWRLKIEGLRG
jgi:cysteinyl-tRNA synthetase